MRRRLVLGYLGLTLLVVLSFGIPLTTMFVNSERDALLARVERQAFEMSAVAQDKVAVGNTQALQQAAGRAVSDGARIIIVDRTGNLLADSRESKLRTPPRTYRTRPEVRRALIGDVVRGSRGSKTLGYDVVYVAVPVMRGTTVVGAVRITYPASEIRRELVLYTIGVIVVLSAALGLAAIAAMRLARWTSGPLETLEFASAQVAAGKLETRANDEDGPPEVRAVAHQFNAMVEHLQQLLDSQQSFVADASHQLRTPLAALRLRLENLEPDVNISGQTDLVAALAETDRMSRIITGLLTLARADASRSTPRQLDLGTLASDRVSLLRPLAANVGVGLDLQVTIENACVCAVEDHVTQVIDNLITNAIAASKSGETIVVRVERTSANEIDLSIQDQGTGMSSKELAHAFDRFWRSTRAKGSGSGLGLAIVQRLANVDRARVELRNRSNGGFEARVVYPAYSENLQPTGSEMRALHGTQSSER